jgi:hypothetical protein
MSDGRLLSSADGGATWADAGAYGGPILAIAVDGAQ